MRERIANAVRRFIMGFPNAKVSAIETLDLTKRSETVSLVRNVYAEPRTGYLANLAEPKKPDSDYAVSGTPRHIPWHIRKREREAAARTRRRQLESLRDIKEGN